MREIVFYQMIIGRLKTITTLDMVQNYFRITFKDSSVNPNFLNKQCSPSSRQEFPGNHIAWFWDFFSERDANTAPWALLTTTPIPASLVSSKIALSKLVLYEEESGGFHLTFRGQGFFGFGQIAYFIDGRKY